MAGAILGLCRVLLDPAGVRDAGHAIAGLLGPVVDVLGAPTYDAAWFESHPEHWYRW